MELRNTNPQGAVDLYHPTLGHLALDAGEVFDVPAAVGKDLLEQVGNFEAVETTKAAAAKKEK